MKKGFTLMEILAVLLIIAVVLSLAVPAFRVVRQDVRNSQAKAAAKKLAEAVKTFYVESHGGQISQGSCFTPTGTGSTGFDVINAAPDTCTAGATGVPGQGNFGFNELFACGYLERKDFVSLPYTFCNSKTTGECTSCTFTPQGTLLVVACGANGAGDKYAENKGCIYVDSRMEAMDTYE